MSIIIRWSYWWDDIINEFTIIHIAFNKFKQSNNIILF